MSDRMLTEALPLHDPRCHGSRCTELVCIRDLERWCRSRLDAWLPRLVSDAEPSDYDWLLAHTMSQAVVLAPRFDIQRGGRITKRGGTLSGWLLTELRWDLVDEIRSYLGSHGQHRAWGEDKLGLEGFDPDFASAPVGGDHPASDGFRGPGSKGALDPAFADREDAFRGLLAARDREADREERRLGIRAGRRSEKRPARAARPVASGPWHDCRCGWRTYPEAPNGIDRWHYPGECIGCGRRIRVAVASAA